MRISPDPLASLALAGLLALSGCALTLDLNTERSSSQATSNHADGPLKAHLTAYIPAGESGFHLLLDGHAALAARLALAQRVFDVETTLIQRGLLRALQTLPIEEHL